MNSCTVVIAKLLDEKVYKHVFPLNKGENVWGCLRLRFAFLMKYFIL